VNRMNPLFLFDYHQCKERFLKHQPVIEAKWSNVIVQSFSLKDETSMDLIYATPKETKQLLLITTGLHGIEGYVGAAMLELFMNEFVSKIDHQSTGLCLIHGINGWGMKNFRKANENNIDLNRNFVWDWTDTPSLINESYEELNWLFHPKTHYSNRTLQSFSFAMSLGRALRQMDQKTITRAVTLGQYNDSKGVYYGGTDYEIVTTHLMELYERLFSTYKSIILLDIHTGYGPKDQMYMVNSRFEHRKQGELTDQLNYPFIITSTPEQFYEINGDMIDYMYRVQQSKFPKTQLFATTLEFGTLGDSLYGQLKSLQATIEETDHYFRKRGNQSAISRLFQKLYGPTDLKWQYKAVADCNRAFKGIINGFSL
jgi:hypothetical protein